METLTKPRTIEELKSLSFDELTPEEFQLLADEKKKQQARARARAKEKYERQRNELIMELSIEAIELSDKLMKFKEKCMLKMSEMHENLKEYGDLRGNSKGGFSLISNDANFKIRFGLVNNPVWDERAQKAAELLHDFLGDTVKKRDKALHDIILTFLEKNKEGQFEYSRIQKLYQHEDKFTDERWREAIRLFKESFSTVFAKNRIEFYSAKGDNSYEPIPLNLSRLWPIPSPSLKTGKGTLER